MRRAEGAPRHQPAFPERARSAVNARHLQRLFKRHIRQNTRQAARHHGLAAARRADHQHVMSACRCDLQRALGALLAADVGKIASHSPILHQRRIGHRLFRRNPLLTAQVVNCLLQMRNRQHIQSFHARRLFGVIRRHQQRTHALFPCADGHGQRTAHADHIARQRQFAHGRYALKAIGIEHPAGCHDRQRNRQIKRRAFFFCISRREVERQPGHGKMHPAAGHRRAHALPALLDRRIRKAHKLIHRHAVRAECLDRYLIAFDSGKAHGLYAGKHMQTSFRETLGLPP